jgi:hypothetical protein
MIAATAVAICPSRISFELAPVSVALCELHESSERAPFPTVPTLVFDNRCDAEAFESGGPTPGAPICIYLVHRKKRSCRSF